MTESVFTDRVHFHSTATFHEKVVFKKLAVFEESCDFKSDVRFEDGFVMNKYCHFGGRLVILHTMCVLLYRGVSVYRTIAIKCGDTTYTIFFDAAFDGYIDDGVFFGKVENAPLDVETMTHLKAVCSIIKSDRRI